MKTLPLRLSSSSLLDCDCSSGEEELAEEELESRMGGRDAIDDDEQEGRL